MATSATPFDPIPDSNVTIYLDLGGRTYRVQKITSYAGGDFQDLFGDLASVVVQLFNSTSLGTLRKVENGYDSDLDEVSTTTVETADAYFSPPVPYSIQEIDGSSILATDQRVYVAGKDLKSDSEYALHELQVR